MKTFVLIDLTKDGAIVHDAVNPADLDLDLVSDSIRWQIAFREEAKRNAGGPLTVVVNVACVHYRFDPDKDATLVKEEMANAYMNGEFEPYLSDGPLLDIGGDG